MGPSGTKQLMLEYEELIELLFPKGPCRYMVYTWVLKGLLYHDFGAHLCTIVVLGRFGIVFTSSPTSYILTNVKERSHLFGGRPYTKEAAALLGAPIGVIMG